MTISLLYLEPLPGPDYINFTFCQEDLRFETTAMRNFCYCDIARVKTFFPSPMMNFSTSDVRGRDGGQRASIPWDIPSSVLALPPVPCRCHPCYRQDVAPGGLFMFCGQTLMDDYSSIPRVIRTADRLLRAI